MTDPKTEDVQQVPWHALSDEEVLERVQGAREGLDQAEVRRRLDRHGPNALERQETVGWLTLLGRQLHSPLIYLLIGAAAVSAATGHWVDAGVILGVVIANTILGLVQERRAEQALEALHRLAAPHARVLRGGQPTEVPADGIVPGDLLLLETGDRVAADARIIEAGDLHLNESALTGESQPAAKRSDTLAAQTPLAERANMAWTSTPVTAGRGKALVVATGMATQIGQIAREMRTTTDQQTPLQRRLARLSTWLGVAGIALAGVIFLLGLLRGYGTMEMVLYAVAVAVSAIPEGLPAVISVTLALGVQRMARHNAIIRNLPAVETLGSTTVICTDKTGTITQNEMTVRTIWTPDGSYQVTGGGYENEGQIDRGADEQGNREPESSAAEPAPRASGGHARPLNAENAPPALRRLLEIGALCNNARLERDAEGARVVGTPTEGAILAASGKAGLTPEALAQDLPRLHELPFSSEKKYMATLHARGDGRLICVKGAPDRVLEFCTHVLAGGERVELDDQRRREIQQANDELSGRAMRVVAGACREGSAGTDTIQDEDATAGLTLAGLWGIVDPPRDEAARAVAAAQQAGIRVVMITGDHAVTAAAIAQQVGIAPPGSQAVAGNQIDGMDEPALAAKAREIGVFARVSPAHKVKILRSLQAEGEVVAMTGDGVNDGPALRGAHIGVAMGRTGTEVAKEASDMILTDDNFATIVHAVEEGRVIFNNLRRVAFFLIATNLGEILTLGAALMLGLPLPLTAVMILWVNLVTDGAATVPLGMERRHRNVLTQKPRPVQAGLLDRPAVLRIVLLSSVMAAGTLLQFFLELRSARADALTHAQTMAFTTLSAFQWFQAFNARSRHESVFAVGLLTNRWLLGGIGLAVLLQWLAVQTPLGNSLFKTVPLAAIDWLLIVATASSIMIVEELLKRFRPIREP